MRVHLDGPRTKLGPSFLLLLPALAFAKPVDAQTQELKAMIDREADRLEPQVIEWRRDFYQNQIGRAHV